MEIDSPVAPRQTGDVSLTLGIVAFSLTCLFLFYEMALQSSTSVMTHQLMRDLSVTASGVGVISGFYFISYTIMQIPAGLFFDRYNVRYIITGALTICVLGALFFAMATSANLAAFGRFFMGIGSAFAFIGALVIAARWFPPSAFAFLVGITQFLAAAGAMGGEVPMSAAVNNLGWRGTMHWIFIIGVVLAIFCWIFIRPRKNHSATSEEAHVERRSVSSSLVEVLGSKQNWAVCLYAFAGWAPVTAFAELWGVPYLMKMYHISSTYAATAIAMIWIGQALSSPLIGALSDMIKRRCILLSLTAAVGLICSLIVIYIPALPMWVLFSVLFLFGIATAGQILTFAVAKDNNRFDVTATVMGFTNMALVASGAVCQPLVGYLIKLSWDGLMLNNTPDYSVANFRFALIVVPVMFLIALLTSMFIIKETHCKPKYPHGHQAS